MANYLTRFSCLLPLGKPEDVPVARVIYDELAAELLKHEATTPGFTLSVAPDSAETALLLVSDDVADPEWVISFVLRCAALLPATCRASGASAGPTPAPARPRTASAGARTSST
ncbi:MAG: hypothetical protein ACRYGL_01580, partial [Janthinobacterium lividum]